MRFNNNPSKYFYVLDHCENVLGDPLPALVLSKNEEDQWAFAHSFQRNYTPISFTSATKALDAIRSFRPDIGPLYLNDNENAIMTVLGDYVTTCFELRGE